MTDDRWVLEPTDLDSEDFEIFLELMASLPVAREHEERLLEELNRGSSLRPPFWLVSTNANRVEHLGLIIDLFSQAIARRESAYKASPGMLAAHPGGDGAGSLKPGDGS